TRAWGGGGLVGRGAWRLRPAAEVRRLAAAVGSRGVRPRRRRVTAPPRARRRWRAVRAYWGGQPASQRAALRRKAGTRSVRGDDGPDRSMRRERQLRTRG